MIALAFVMSMLFKLFLKETEHRVLHRTDKLPMLLQYFN
jgi:hypothetical protein